MCSPRNTTDCRPANENGGSGIVEGIVGVSFTRSRRRTEVPAVFLSGRILDTVLRAGSGGPSFLAVFFAPEEFPPRP